MPNPDVHSELSSDCQLGRGHLLHVTGEEIQSERESNLPNVPQCRFEPRSGSFARLPEPGKCGGLHFMEPRPFREENRR
jgi:hypothetical protein